MTQWPVPTTNSIVVGGLPLYLELEAGSDGDDILPGDLVEFVSTTDCTVKAGQADSSVVIGVADISPQSTTTPPRGSSRTVAYAAADQVKIIRGPCMVMLRIELGSTIGCGDYVQPAASGQVKEYYCVTDNDCQRIAQAMESTPVSTTTFQWAMFALERFG